MERQRKIAAILGEKEPAKQVLETERVGANDASKKRPSGTPEQQIQLIMTQLESLECRLHSLESAQADLASHLEAENSQSLPPVFSFENVQTSELVSIIHELDSTHRTAAFIDTLSLLLPPGPTLTPEELGAAMAGIREVLDSVEGK